AWRREAVVRRQAAAQWRRARGCDRERWATWLDDDADGVRVGKEGLRIVGPDQAIGHDVVEGIVAHASIGVAGRIGDVAAQTEWRLILRGLRRVREGTLIGWPVGLFVKSWERTGGRTWVWVRRATAAFPGGGRTWVPARTVLRTVRVGGTRHIIWKRPASWEPRAPRFPVVAPDVRSRVGGAV